MSKKLEDICREKLANHTQTPPEGLWQEIEAALPPAATDTTAEPSAARRLSRRAQWLWAAAVAALVVVGATMMKKKEEPAVVAKATVEQKTKKEKAAEEKPTEGPAEEVALEKKEGTKGLATTQKSAFKEEKTSEPTLPTTSETVETEGIEPTEQTPMTEACEIPEENLTAMATEPQPSPSDPIATASTERKTVHLTLPDPLPPLDNDRRSRSRSAMGLSLFAGGVDIDIAKSEDYCDASAPPHAGTGTDFPGWIIWPGDENVASGDDNPDSPTGDTPSPGVNTGTLPFLPPYSTGQPGQAIRTGRHRRPMRLGLTLSLPLTDRLSLNGGLTMARLWSEALYNDYRTHYGDVKKQTNIGIPLSATYRICSLRPVSLYVGGGAMVEQCIEGEERRPQLSVFGAAGANIQLGRSVALYAEPTLGYYFDNGSQAFNIYKEKPTQIDLRLGIRINLNKTKK